jgi:hypothetical protein
VAALDAVEQALALAPDLGEARANDTIAREAVFLSIPTAEPPRQAQPPPASAPFATSGPSPDVQAALARLATRPSRAFARRSVISLIPAFLAASKPGRPACMV